MKTETNEKVLAMYQAVCALLEEGCDICLLYTSRCV